MEGNGRRLAWIAIALSALALFISFGSMMRSHAQVAWGPRAAFGPPAFTQPGDGPQAVPGGKFGHRFEQRFQDEQRFQEFRGPGPFGGRHMGPGAFFFWPFMLLGKLLKLAFVVLLVWLGLRLLRGRNGGNGRWGRGGDQPPSRPGPEQPPYTGDTTQI
jgi:hypothetical protein